MLLYLLFDFEEAIRNDRGWTVRSWLLQNSIRVASLLDGYLRKGGFCFLARRLRR